MTVKLRLRQAGATAIEFPFVVIGIMVIVFGLVSIYRLMHLQTRLDSAAFMVTNAVSRTFNDNATISLAGAPAGTDTKSLSWQINQLDIEDVFAVVIRTLPKHLDSSQIGLELEIRRAHPTTQKVEIFSGSSQGGVNCSSNESVSQLDSLAPTSQRPETSLNDRKATLVQTTICINQPFSADSQFVLSGVVLPEFLSSKAVMLGRHYAR
ncbi:tight adherence pilus pseudopilin TadF [Vibrio sp. TBV020]|uniref:tight adherence pilus pseudopilin TadF n=1 Tax=Vibrio sp. TBV020 TaxID=3137398 RepID=UPI0038CD8D4A